MTFKEKTFELINKNEVVFNDLITYVNLIEKTNKSINLTGFTGDSLWREGIYQSIILMQESFHNTEDKQMLDIGAGVGFPSIPFLIYKRNFDLFISEPNNKRVDFLKKVNEELSLNISFITVRIEDYQENQTFDMITARAVTSLKNLIEISSKVGSINAEYSFLKGPKIYDELADSKWIIDELSITPTVHKTDVQIDSSNTQTHYLLKYIKIKMTPSIYPRKWLLISLK